MSDRHIIRLRGPWWGHPVPDNGVEQALEAFKTTCPFSAGGNLGDDFSGTVRLLRKFNGSSGMIDASNVWLHVSSLAVPAEVVVNQISIAMVPSQIDYRLSIASYLRPFNQLELVLQVSQYFADCQPQPNSVSLKPLVGEVAIEIGQD